MGLAIPALANAKRTHAAHRTSRTLHMTRKYNHTIMRPRNHRAASIATPPAATLLTQGYNCAVTVAYGHTGNQTLNTHTTDSTEFGITYTQGADTLMSVTSNCIGMLPAGKTPPNTIVTHSLTSCAQFNPVNPSGPVIFGSGISTTFPDGLYSETCNTPNFPS